MLDLNFTKYPGYIHWYDNDTPDIIKNIDALWVNASGTFATKTKDLLLCNLTEKNPAQLIGSSSHGRSCYLGKADESHFFAKGVGWIFADGWAERFGSRGILPLWAASRERDLAKEMLNIGIPSVKPECIVLHKTIPLINTNGQQFIDAKEVIDLDGTKAHPSIYIYSSNQRWRLADLYYMTNQERNSLLFTSETPRLWLMNLAAKLSTYSGILHKNNGHDYSLSAHNVFIDGTRLDFEYAVVHNHKHPVDALNKDLTVWKQKELFALQTMCWEIAELLRAEISLNDLNKTIIVNYEAASKSAFDL